MTLQKESGNERILVVDDDPYIAMFPKAILSAAGYDVSVASDGQTGLEKAEALQPDLVLLDVMMPGIDGFEVAERLRRNPRTANMAIIMLTAKASSTDRALGLAAGADDYIVQPFDPVDLLARAKAALRRHEAVGHLARPFFGHSDAASEDVASYLALRGCVDYLAAGFSVETRRRPLEAVPVGSGDGGYAALRYEVGERACRHLVSELDDIPNEMEAASQSASDMIDLPRIITRGGDPRDAKRSQDADEG